MWDGLGTRRSAGTTARCSGGDGRCGRPCRTAALFVMGGHWAVMSAAAARWSSVQFTVCGVMLMATPPLCRPSARPGNGQRFQGPLRYTMTP